MASSPATAPPPESKSPSTNSTSPPTSESSTPPPVLAPPPSSPPPFSPPPPFPPPSSPPPSSSPPLHFSPPPLASSPPPPPVSTPPPQFSSPPPPDPPLPAPIFLSPPVPPSPKGSGTPPSPTLPPPSLSPPTPPSSSGSTPPSPTLPPPSPPSSTPPSSFKPPPSSDDLLPPPPPKRPASAPPRSLAPPTNNNNANSNKSSSGSDVNLPMVAGIAAGIALFFLIIGIAACVCYRKKKKKPRNPTNYHPDAGVKGNDYYNRGAAPPKRNNGGQDALAKLPPPPGMARNASSSSPPSINNESSVNYSGPNGPAVQSSSPSITLGFIKSTFSYEELATATNGFSEENILGQGGFGYVHKGILPNGQEVAVKQLKAGSGQGEREFQAEVEIISRVHHRHLVSLIGYCIVGSQRLLVYEFVPNKTLEFHLHGKNQPTMDWPTRMRIALGSAKGLAYLHEDCHPRIIHRDIKASNILLDYRFEAKVADFGLAKLSSDNYTHISTRVMGTFGYLAPEYASSGKLSEKSDIFSFGVMLLELITGKRPIHNNPMEDSLVDWARPLLTQALADENYDELVDPKLEGSYTKMEMTRMVACAATSVRHSAKMRPKMSQIVRALEGDSSLEDLTDGVKPGQSMLFTSSSEHESGSYASNMNRFRRAAFDSNELSQEYSGLTSDYGLNPSSSSSSGEISTVRYASSRQSGSQQ